MFISKKTLIKTTQIHTNTDEYNILIQQTKTRLKKIKKHRPMVSFSGGKDSTVMAHLSIKTDVNIPVFHWDWGIFMPRKIENDIVNNAKKIGVDNLIVRKRYSQDKSKVVGFRAFFGALNKVSKEYNIDLHLIGLRAEESYTRKYRTKTPFKNEFYPIYDWSWLDVWTYIIINNLPYPDIYDKYAKIYGYDKVRFVSFFDPEFDYLGAGYIDGCLMPENKNAGCINPFR